jgi:predicted acetyltransferase
MSERFRFAREEELSDLAAMVGHSFVGRPQEKVEEILGRGSLGGLEVLWVGEEADGRVTSACHLLRLEQWFGGAKLPTMGLAMVAVSPARRRRGVAGRLVTAGLRHARERGDALSALYPFRIRFYEGLGYGLAGEAHQYMVPPENLPDAPDRARVEMVRSDADRDAVRLVYDRWAPRENGQLVRREGNWKRAWENASAGAVYRDEHGEPQGYALLRYRTDLPPESRFLDVEERAWLTPAARRGILAWLGTLGDQWRLVAYRAHPEEGFADGVREPRLPPGSAPGWGLWFPAATLLVGPMVRILDMEAAWSARRVATDADLTVGLEVADEAVPENAGAWRLRLEGGAVSVERSAAGGVDVTLRLKISTLSRIFAGAMSPTAAVDHGIAEADRADRLAALDAALRMRRPWTFDRF